MQTVVAEVALDSALEEPLDYSIPEALLDAKIGMRVEVPLRGRSAKGVIVSLKEKSLFAKLKPITRLLNEEPLISKELFELAHWISKYYVVPVSKVLKSLLPPALRDEKGKHKTQSFIKPLISQNEMRDLCENLRTKSPSQARVLDLLLQNFKGLLLTQILEGAKVSASPIQTLCKQGVLQLQEMRIDRSPLFACEFFPTLPKKLSSEQQETLNAILSECNSFKTHLIHGVTGSGKTEIYLQAIDHVLKQGKGVIYLVPEIALTSQTIERFKGRFGTQQIAILHHRLSQGERFDSWHKIRTGEAKIVIGARSAIFSPVKHLGMIIVDEEHEPSYKQSDETPKYHARDVAVLRGKFANCPVILGSATPCLESYYNAMSGKYVLHTLKQRANHAKLPTIELVNMQREFEIAKGFTLFSQKLLDGIKQRIQRGEQTLLFLNRRGYHTAAYCPLCSHVIECPHCDLSLTYHVDKTLSCHLCDYRREPPRTCPNCHAEGALKFKGAGTEMVEKALHALFPTIRTLRLDADTTKHKGSHERLFKEFRSGKADVLIGTQMIAKGLHFPLVTLVGVLGVDGGLHIPDFRASEQIFQLLIQVAGRCGRGELPGEVLIQTHLMEHPTIQWAIKQDYEAFYAEEIKVRELFTFPPFTHLVKFSFSGEDEEQTKECAEQFREQLVRQFSNEVEIYPVVACGYTKIKDRYRFQCILKVKQIQKILKKLSHLRKEWKQEKGLHLSIDVDPLSTFF